jgi:hypothetical protein
VGFDLSSVSGNYTAVRELSQALCKHTVLRKSAVLVLSQQSLGITQK